MNYGIGGQISAHVDSMDVENTSSGEYINKAGPRIITFMMYLSDVIAGGRTVFHQLGISVKPKKVQHYIGLIFIQMLHLTVECYILAVQLFLEISGLQISG